MKGLRFSVVYILFLFYTVSVYAQSLSRSSEKSHKIFLRSSSGYISNVGTVSGSAFTYAGANVGIAFYVMEQLAAGVGYKVESDLKVVPLKGWDIFGRYYFMGSGTRVLSYNKDGEYLVTHKLWSPYLGIEFSNRDFIVEDPNELDPLLKTLSGTTSAMNLMFGVDYRITDRFELNTELNVTAIAFGGSDTRFAMRWMLLELGFNFLF